MEIKKFNEWVTERENLAIMEAVEIPLELVTAALAGDESAMTQVITLVFKVSRAWCAKNLPRYLGVRQDFAASEDIAQDVATDMHQMLKKQSIQKPQSLVPMAISMSRNKLLTYTRDRRNQANVIGTHGAAKDDVVRSDGFGKSYHGNDKESGGVDNSVVDSEERQMMKQAIAQLDDRYRQAINDILKSVDPVEAAAKMGVPRATYDSIKSRAKVKLKELMQQMGAFESFSEKNFNMLFESLKVR
jgi:RNA polymerase sigma factor (sigma-70 family)